MSNSCPFCDSNVENHGIECDNCNKWVHYACTHLPPYMVMQFSKSTRQFTCEMCVLVKFGAKYPTLLTDIEDEIEAHKSKRTAPLLAADVHPATITDIQPIADPTPPLYISW